MSYWVSTEKYAFKYKIIKIYEQVFNNTIFRKKLLHFYDVFESAKMLRRNKSREKLRKGKDHRRSG